MATVKQEIAQPVHGRVHILELAIRAFVWTHAAVRYTDGQTAPLAAGTTIPLDAPIEEDSLACKMLVSRLCPGATTCKSEYEIRAFLSEIIVARQLGWGFHPDTPFDDYIHRTDGSRVFTDKEARQYDRQMNEAFNFYASSPNPENIYDLCMELMNELYHSSVGQ